MNDTDETSTGTYKAEVRCVNCGYEAEMEFNKGKSVAWQSSKCPNCECLGTVVAKKQYSK